MQHAGFMPLAVFLRPPRAASSETQALPPQPAPNPLPDEYAQALGAARRFHAGLRDALEMALEECLQRIAQDVLARELRLAPADVGEIVKAALDSCTAQDLLSIRAHPADLEALRAFDLELVGDCSLRQGDIVLVLRSGTIDLTLSARLEAALATWNA